jgi:hypothetical protein
MLQRKLVYAKRLNFASELFLIASRQIFECSSEHVFADRVREIQNFLRPALLGIERDETRRL